jgi:hypothetical protein
VTNVLRLILAAPLVVAAWACITDRGPRAPLSEFNDLTEETPS